MIHDVGSMSRIGSIVGSLLGGILLGGGDIWSV
jgi:hypothetical protein